MEFVTKVLEGTTFYDKFIYYKTQLIYKWEKNRYLRVGTLVTVCCASVLITQIYWNNISINNNHEYKILTHNEIIQQIRLNAKNNNNNNNDSNNDEKKDDSDSDDDDDGNDDDEEKESLKLAKKLENHKNKMKMILKGLVFIDLGMSILLAFPYHDIFVSKTDLKKAFKYQRLFNFKGDTFDCFVGSLIKMSVFVGMVNLNVLWGNVEHYKEIQVMDKKTGNTKEIAVWDSTKARYANMYIVIVFF